MTQINSPNETLDPLTPPDNFGQEVIDEFTRRAGLQTENAADEAGDTSSEADDPSAVQDAPDAAGGSGDTSDDLGEGVSAATAPEPAPAGTPTGAPTDTPEPAATDTATPEPAAEPTPEPAPTSGYTWVDGDRSYDFSDTQVREALNLSAWAHNLTPAMRESFASLEAGTHRAIPESEYLEYKAWKDSGGASAYDEYADPTERELARLRAELEAMRAGVNPANPANPANVAPSPVAGAAPAQYAQAQYTQATDNTLAIMNQAKADYAASHGLTESEVDSLTRQAIDMNIIPAIADSEVIRNPATGQVIAQGDPTRIMHTALDVALTRNPELHNRMIANTAGTNTTTNDTPQVTPGDQELSAPLATEANDALARKKARAASVASAPASTTPPSAPSVAKMSREQLTNAMAQDLAAVLSGQ